MSEGPQGGWVVVPTPATLIGQDHGSDRILRLYRVFIDVQTHRETAVGRLWSIEDEELWEFDTRLTCRPDDLRRPSR